MSSRYHSARGCGANVTAEGTVFNLIPILPWVMGYGGGGGLNGEGFMQQKDRVLECISAVHTLIGAFTPPTVAVPWVVGLSQRKGEVIP